MAQKVEVEEEKDNVDKVVSTIIKISLVVSKEDEAKVRACEYADSLLQNMFNNVENAGNQVANAILVSLGLLKGEDKKYKAPNNLTGPLMVLEHIVRQAYFTKSARDAILIFISKPHPSLEKTSEARHKILQTLYAF